ncbi:recombinase [Clostridium sporogenes]|nr:recombinase [Clostridium sporogenes]
MNVYEKLMNVQATLKAPKSQYNSFGKYSYRSCEDILESLKPLLKENKAIVNITDEIIEINSRFYIKATATFIDIEKGDKVQASALAREDETKKGMDLAQVTGSVSSYARKYALNGLFAIDDNKDSDSTNTHGKGNKQDNTTQETNKAYKCNKCGVPVVEKVAKFSYGKFKKVLCFDCQKKEG